MDSTILRLAEMAGSFYLYDAGRIRGEAEALLRAFPGAEFLYSVKCNPDPNVLEAVFSAGLGADAASLREVRLASAHLAPERIFYSAPGKTAEDLRGALPLCTLAADSTDEVRLIAALGADARIGLRINPDFTMDGDGGAPSKFGIDEAEALRLMRDGCPGVRVDGIHVHLKSQVTDTETLVRYYARVLRLAERAEAALGRPLSFVNLGSGIGVAYEDGAPEPDLNRLGRETAALLAEYRAGHPRTRVLIETGRRVVCRAGVYVTHVVDRKVSRGRTYVILQDTMNAFLRPSLARLMPAAAEPLRTERGAFPIETSSCLAPERVTLAGSLCTASDVIAEDILLPRLAPGDLVLLRSAGAYAASLSPQLFSSKPAPREFTLMPDGSVRG